LQIIEVRPPFQCLVADPGTRAAWGRGSKLATKSESEMAQVIAEYVAVGGLDDGGQQGGATGETEP